MRKTLRLPYDHRDDAERVLDRILRFNYSSALLPQGFVWKVGRVTQHRNHFHLLAIGWVERG
jgi:hypothetical protein